MIRNHQASGHTLPHTARLIAATLAVASLASPLAATDLSLISQPNGAGTSGNFHSVAPDIDASGDVIVFASSANNLVAGDTGPLSDVFVYTRESDGLFNVTQGSNDNSGNPQLSADGRYVVFVSSATDLTSGDANGHLPNVFLFDRQNESFQIGPALSDFPFDGSSYTSAERFLAPIEVSENAAVVALISTSNSVTPDTPTMRDQRLYLWRPASGTVQGVALQASGGISRFSLSDDGRFVVFESAARDLVDPPFATAAARLYLYDIEAETVEWLIDGMRPRLSAAGRHVAFNARAENGVPGGRGFDLFTLDTQTNETIWINQPYPGANPIVDPDAEVGTRSAGISGDGNRVAYLSAAPFLVEDDRNGALDVFVWSRATGRNVRLTPNADRGSNTPALNQNGQVAAFASAANNLTDLPDNNGFFDVFAWRENPAEDDPECAPFPSGVLTSSSGATVRLQGTTRCLGDGLFSYGATDSTGLLIPAARGRPELRLVPQNEGNLPPDELVFFTYPADNDERLFATNFFARDTGHLVQMTFRSASPLRFPLYELAVYAPGTLNREQLLYREQDTQWAFMPEAVGDVLNIGLSVFTDTNDDALRNDGERGLPFVSTTLFFCNNREGLVGTERTDDTGELSYRTLEPAFYQLAVRLGVNGEFSSPAFDGFGSQINAIKAIVKTPDATIGYTDCTDFTNGARRFGAVGVQQR